MAKTIGLIAAGVLLWVGPLAAQDARVDQLVRDLGSADWKDRERAACILEEDVQQVWPLLLPARRHRDPEVASQVESLLRRAREHIATGALEDEFLRIALLDSLGVRHYDNPELEERAVQDARDLLVDPARIDRAGHQIAEAIERVGPAPATWALVLSWRAMLEDWPWDRDDPLLALALRDPRGLERATSSLRIPPDRIAPAFLLADDAGPLRLPSPLAAWLLRAASATRDEPFRRRALLGVRLERGPALAETLAAMEPLSPGEADLVLALRARVGEEQALHAAVARFGEMRDHWARRLVLEAGLLGPPRPLPAAVLEAALDEEDRNVRPLALALAIRLGREDELDRVRAQLAEDPDIGAYGGLLDVRRAWNAYDAWGLLEEAPGAIRWASSQGATRDEAISFGALALLVDHASAEDWAAVCDRILLRGGFRLREAIEALPIGPAEFLEWLVRHGGEPAESVVRALASEGGWPEALRLLVRDDPSRAGPLYRRSSAAPWRSPIEVDLETALVWARSGTDEDAASVARRIFGSPEVPRDLRIEALDALRTIAPDGWLSSIEDLACAEGARYRETNRLPDPAVFHAALDRLEGEGPARAAGALTTLLGQTMLPWSVTRHAIRLAGRFAATETRLRDVLVGLIEADWNRVMCPPVVVSQSNEVALLETLADLAPAHGEARRAALRLRVARSFPLEDEREPADEALRRLLAASPPDEARLWVEALEEIEPESAPALERDVLAWLDGLEEPASVRGLFLLASRTDRAALSRAALERLRTRTGVDLPESLAARDPAPPREEVEAARGRLEAWLARPR